VAIKCESVYVLATCNLSLAAEEAVNENAQMALIAMAGAAIANIATNILAYLKSRDALLVSRQNGREIRDVHLRINGRLAELLEASVAKARAEGILTGISQEAERQRLALLEQRVTSPPLPQPLESPNVSDSRETRPHPAPDSAAP
jgi:hypothetical protein